MSDESRRADDEQGNDDRVSDVRRRLLQTVAAAAVGLAVLPSSWTKPVVGTIIVPAHAAMSPASPLPSMSVSVSASQPVTPAMTPGATASVSQSMRPTPPASSAAATPPASSAAATPPASSAAAIPPASSAAVTPPALPRL